MIKKILTNIIKACEMKMKLIFSSERAAKLTVLIKKEFLAIWKDPRSRAIIVIPPILQLFLFANAITMEIRHIHVGVWDMDNTYESREFISRFKYSRRFEKVIPLQTKEELKNNINTQKIQMAIIIENDFSTTIKRGKTATVQIIVDGRQTNSAAIISGYVTQIIHDYSNEVSAASGADINIVARNWHNPNLEYQWFLLISLITILSLVVTLILTALSIAREREMGTFDQLVVSPLNSFEILLGKTIPPLIIAIIITAVMTWCAVFIFKVPFVGSVFWFFLSVITALLSIVGVGLFVSSLCRTQQQAILGAFTFQTPAIILSGFISPVENMPVFVQKITYADPVRFFMVLTKGIFLKDMQPPDIIDNLIPLILIAAFTLTLAAYTFKRKLD